MSDILAKLFGSSARVKILRLFLLNPEKILSLKEISRRAKVLPDNTRKEIFVLSNIGFISKKREIVKEPAGEKEGVFKKKKKEGWVLEKSFPLFYPLKNLILNAAPLSKDTLLKKISRAGKIKLVVLAGIFIQDENSRVDILVVGDNIRKGILEKSLKEIEAEVGKELDYAFFSTKEFFYRLNIYDKFIRDILDYPHEKILDKLGIRD